VVRIVGEEVAEQDPGPDARSEEVHGSDPDAGRRPDRVDVAGEPERVPGERREEVDQRDEENGARITGPVALTVEEDSADMRQPRLAQHLPCST
jgi:hypothetical protein